jgi:ubiquinone/menaquinone biosynthesis C-methylase UbiE
LPHANQGYVSPDALGAIARKALKYKRRIYELIRPDEGIRLLDVGCGPGLDSGFYANVVGDKGLAVGIDLDPWMIKLALARSNNKNIVFAVGDAQSTPFASGYFDACVADRLLQHAADAVGVINELVRVTAAGGQIIVADSDWCTLSIDMPDYELERRFVRAILKVIKNGCAGRQLRRLLSENGVTDVTIEVHPIVWQSYNDFRETSLSISDINKKLVASGYVTETDLHLVKMAMDEREGGPTFFANANVLVASGVKRR